MRQLAERIERLPKATIIAFCLAAVVVLGILDWQCPPQISFTLFYLLVVAFAAFAAGKWAGAFITLASALAPAVGEWQHSGGALHVWVTCWNGAVRLGIFLFTVFLVTAMKRLTANLEKRAAQRTAQLEQEIQGRARTEVKLRESMERFQQLAENITEVFWMTDPQKNQMLYISPGYERIWGRTCASLYQSPRDWLDGIHAEDRERVTQAATAKQATGEYDEEYRIVRPDGSVRWIHDRAFPIRDATRQVFRLVGIAEDITERKLAGEAVRESENRYRSLIEAAQDFIFTVSLDGTITSLNAAFETLTEWRREEWIGKPFTGLLGPGDLPVARAMLDLVARGEKTPVFEIRVRTKSGGLVVAQFSATPLMRDGQVTGSLGIARDITKNKQHAEHLQTQAKVLESMAEGLIVTDRQGFVVLTNPAADKLWAYPPEELKGRPVALLSQLPEPEARAFFSSVRKEVDAQGHWNGELENVSKDGRRFLTQADVTKVELDGRTLLVLVQQDITDRKLAEKALKRQREELQIILDTVPASIFYKDKGNRFLRINQAFAEVLGRPKEEIEGRPCSDFFSPAVVEMSWQEDKEVMESGRPLRNKVKPSGLPGKIQWVQTDKVPYRDENGNIAGVVAFALDITKHKEAEDALRESEAFLHSIVENIPDMIFVKDARQLRFVMFNKAGEELIGRSRNDLIGKSDLDLFPADEAREFTSKDQAVLRDKRLLVIPEEKVQTKQWGERILYTKKIPILDKAGNAQYLLGISEDITERKRAEETLRTQGCVLDSMFEGVSLVDENGVICLTNPTLDAMFGYNCGELAGKHATILNNYPLEENARIAAETINQIEARGVFVGEFQNRRKDGTLFICEARISSLAIGNKRFLVSVQQDITEKKQLERQILEVSDREQARIGQDLHDGLCQQLVSVAFDINQLEQRLAVAARAEAITVSRIAEIMDGAITEARTIARGLFPVQLEADGLSAALRELAANVRARLQVDCRARVSAPALVHDNAVATHLYRIAQEAVNNAVKHSKAKRISIQLITAGGRIELNVADDGTGMPDLPKTQRGLGLHIMDYRARTIGGTLVIGRAPGGGTVVSCCARQPIP